jgi:hypothetical protein
MTEEAVIHNPPFEERFRAQAHARHPKQERGQNPKGYVIDREHAATPTLGREPGDDRRSGRTVSEEQPPNKAQNSVTKLRILLRLPAFEDQQKRTPARL